MEWVETTGKTIEEARDAALDMLGVDESDAEFLTVTEPRPGLFGRLRGEARVHARVMPTTPPPKRNRGRRPPQRRGASGQDDESGEAQQSSKSPRARAGSSARAVVQMAKVRVRRSLRHPVRAMSLRALDREQEGHDLHAGGGAALEVRPQRDRQSLWRRTALKR